MSSFRIKPEDLAAIRWATHPSEVDCGVCGKPVGVAKDDPRWDTHDEYCDDCDLCRDRVPILLFRGEGTAMQRATFHTQCFTGIVSLVSIEARSGRVFRLQPSKEE